MLDIIEDNYKIAQKYLSRFWSPIAFFQNTEEETWWPTEEWKELKRKASHNFDLHDVMKVNNNFPFLMAYTPNWNYWDVNQIVWRRLSRSIWKEWKKPYRNAMVADFDKKECEWYKWKPLNEYLNYLLETYILKPWTPLPDYIQESVWWFHFIWIIAEAERHLISKFISDDDVSNAFFYIQSTSLWWEWLSKKKGTSDTISWIDTRRSRFRTSSLIRMPLSFHRKTWDKIQVKLHQIVKDKTWLVTIHEVVKERDLDVSLESNEITHDLIKIWASKFLSQTKMNKDFSSMIIKNSAFDARIFDDIDKILLPDVLDKLSDTTMSYAWREYFLKYDIHTKLISMIYRDSWEVYTPSWYAYRPEHNIIYDFNTDKPWDERPQNTTSKFLYYFFGRNRKLVDEFVSKHYKLKLIVWKDEEIWVLRHTSVWDNDILCLPTKIVIKKLVATKSWSVNPKIVDLFHQPFMIIGKWYTTTNASQWESEEQESVFIIKKYWSDEKLLLKCYPTKRLWNMDNISRWLFFYGEDNDLWLFYDSIFKSKDIEEYDIISINWFYNWYYVFWWNIFPMEAHNKIFNVCRTRWFSFDIRRWDVIPIKEYLEIGTKIRDEKMFVPTFLHAIALAWSNIWNRIEWFNQFPWLLLTGTTWSWKTVLHETLSMALWYEKRQRTMSISRTSPQPLKQAGIDGSILHLEEHTDPVKPESADILRDILNRSISSKGTPNKNIIWKFRSAPFVDWETMPESESVANRFVIIPVDQKFWKWTINDILEMQKFSIFEEVLEKRYFLWKDVNNLSKTFNKWVNFLVDAWVNPRSANVWSPIFMVNELFNIWYDDATLLEYAVSLMKDVWISNETTTRTPFMSLQILLAESVMQRKLTVTETDYTNHTTINIIFQKEYMNKIISSLSKIINEINNITYNYYIDKWLDTSTFNKMTLSSPVMSFKINKIDASPTDIALNDLRDRYIVRLPSSIYIYYSWDDKDAWQSWF